MSRSWLRPKVLGLFILALVVIAYAASAVQAEKGASWMTNGANVGKPLSPLLKAEAETSVVFLFTLFGLKTQITCKSVKFTNFKMLPEGSLSEGSIGFFGCETNIEGHTDPECVPVAGGSESSPGTALLVLVGGEGMIRFKSGKEFFTIFEMRPSCVLGKNVSIVGELVLKDCQKKISEELKLHLFEEDTTSSTLKVGANPAVLEGGIWVSLAGEHAGLQWSGLAG